MWLPRLAVAEKLQIEIEPEWNGRRLELNQQVIGAKGAPMSLSRIDGLLSGLALQRTNGQWIEAKDWFALFRADLGRWSAMADGVPAEDIRAIRFRVGLDAATDALDPQAWPAEHPLHPDVCGLHWGWRSGYVFLAMEGHYGSNLLAGFSYHLAGPTPAMTVELPVQFSGRRPAHVRLGMDLAAILDDGAVVGTANATHSRAGDPLAVTMKVRVSRAFRVRNVQADTYQKVPLAALDGKGKGPSASRNGAPYPLAISERLPQVTLPADNPLTVEGVELGRRLFEEPKLSRNGRQACTSCHDRARAFSDGRRQSVGESGQPGRRNAMALANLAWAREFFWDGRARSLREQVLLPIQDAKEMNESLDRAVAKLQADRSYADRFHAVFGSPGVTSERIARALEQFLLTLISQESKFDRAARKLTTLSPQEQRGLQLFVTEHDPARGLRGADCFHCHGGNLFSNQQFLNNGLPEHDGDVGRMAVTGLESDRGKFKVPSLRNVALTGPYMHDGRFATLEDVVEHYNGPLHRTSTLDPNLAKHPVAGLGLSADDKAALVAFLKTLTDDKFVATKAAAPASSRDAFLVRTNLNPSSPHDSTSP